MMARMIISCIVGVVIFAALLAAGRLFARAEQRKVTGAELATAGVFGILVGVVNCFVIFFRPGTALAVLAPICLVAMISMIVYLMYWWTKEGRNLKELLAFVVVVVISYFTMKAAAWMVVAGMQDAFLMSLILAITEMLSLGAIGYFVTNLCYYRYRMTENNVYRIIAIVAGAATILLLVLILIFRVNWKAAPSMDEMTRPVTVESSEASVDTEEVDSEVEVEAGESTESEVDTETLARLEADSYTIPGIVTTWYKYFHYQLLKDDTIYNDFDFGPSAWVEGMTAEQAMEEHIERVKLDPMLGCATFATFDVRLGLDFLIPGEHYDQNWSDGYWTTRINAAIRYYAEHEIEYSVAVERWVTFVRTYAHVKLAFMENVTDQMYAGTLTSQGEWEAPEVIIATTDQPSGHILSYVFLIKGNEFEVPFRSDCGFQPTNVAEVMKETPKANPVEEHYGPKPTEAPQPTSKPNPGGKDDSKPEMDDTYPETVTTPTPTPTPKKKKEPKEDPVNQGNAQKGGGDNRDDDPGEEQKTDPRDEHPTGSDNDNNHGHSDPKTVTPTTPPVVEEHKQEEKEGKIVTDENPVSYEPDPVTDRGPAEAGVSPTAADGDGEFVPLD